MLISHLWLVAVMTGAYFNGNPELGLVVYPEELNTTDSLCIQTVDQFT